MTSPQVTKSETFSEAYKGNNLTTIEQFDEALRNLGPRRLIPHTELPEWLNITGLRVIKETVHEGALHNAGEVKLYAEAGAVVDRLLDERNAITPPPTTEEEADNE